MAICYPTRGSKNPNSTLRTMLLGGFAVTSSSNTEVVPSVDWEVSVDANTTIIRMRSEELAYMKYNAAASSDDYDYFLPPNTTVDIYNLIGASTLSIIAHSSNSHVLITQY